MKKALIIVAMLLMAGMAAGNVRIAGDMPSLNLVYQDETQVNQIRVVNNGNESVFADIQVTGDVSEILEVSDGGLVESRTSENFRILLNGSKGAPKTYIGDITINAGDTTENFPLSIRLVQRENSEVKLDLQATSDQVRPNEPVGIFTVISTSSADELDGIVNYEIRHASSGVLYEQTSYNTSIKRSENAKSFQHELESLERMEIGDYYVQASMQFNNRTVTATDTFQVHDPFWTPTRMRIALFLFVGGLIIGGGFYAQRWYIQHKQEEARYVFPVDYSKLPEEGEEKYWVGKIAETEKEAYVDPDDLTTHAIVSGSTGSGKSVTANVIAEEALENDVPVIVFDPTAQWTGFVKELKDDNLKEHYSRFEMDEGDDPHPYRGIIKEVRSEEPDIDFEQLKQPGEITVFTLNNLTTEEFDSAVRHIIDQIFDIEWEESPTLEMLVVFDEVHRLLEKYGGQGGYHALERGAREFRKWGIGLMMCSQVTADFKQAISGNIMTEVQMQTKSMEDIERIEKKYGEQFAKRISSEDVGVGMIQNSNYNDGQPWFVDFRPTYHNPHKIPDSELEQYHELSRELDKVREAIREREEDGEDMRDRKLELDLADNKLKEGRFKMSRMYIDSLKDEMDIS
jgi:Cdc6-like AAA superfamily ATPase